MNVTILGGNTTAKDLDWVRMIVRPCPELWSLNGIFPAVRHFELHRRSYLQSVYGKRCFRRRAAALQDYERLYTWERWPEVAASSQARYPLRAVWALPHGRWHCGSLDWMVAAAIVWEAASIALVGISFMRGGEPLNGPACLAYWLGLAQGRGIEVAVRGDAIFKNYQLLESERQYGYEDVVLVEQAR